MSGNGSAVTRAGRPAPAAADDGNKLLIITNNRERVFQRSIVAGAEEVGADHGHRVDVLEVPRPADAESLLARLSDLDAGIMLIADVLPDSAVAALHRKGIPITLVSHRVPDLEVPAIVHDNRQGIELLAGEVFERCRRVRPLYIGGSSRQQDSTERETAFRRELMRRGLPIDEARFLSGAFEPRQAAAALADYLEGGGELDAVVAADYLMAIACLEELQQRRLAVPTKVAVVGFGDGAEAQEANLTTVAADVVELGRRAARQLVGQREGLEILGLTLLSTTLIRRATTC